MITEIRGTLVALGMPAPTVYDAFPTESRALVHVSRDAITALEPNLMFTEVAIIAAAELDALREQSERYRLVTLRQDAENAALRADLAFARADIGRAQPAWRKISRLKGTP